MPERFHPLAGLTETEKRAENVREFKGEGTPYLRVPGLLALASVRVGHLAIDLHEEREYPTDVTLTRMERVQEPMFQLDRLDDGTPVLLRSVLSNDGVWQPGVSVFVEGEWEGTPAAAADDASKGKKAA